MNRKMLWSLSSQKCLHYQKWCRRSCHHEAHISSMWHSRDKIRKRTTVANTQTDKSSSSLSKCALYQKKDERWRSWSRRPKKSCSRYLQRASTRDRRISNGGSSLFNSRRGPIEWHLVTTNTGRSKRIESTCILLDSTLNQMWSPTRRATSTTLPRLTSCHRVQVGPKRRRIAWCISVRSSISVSWLLLIGSQSSSKTDTIEGSLSHYPPTKSCP